MAAVSGKLLPGSCHAKLQAPPRHIAMDLIQVGVSVTGSWKKRILCVSPRAGPAQPAALSGHYILYTTCV